VTVDPIRRATIANLGCKVNQAEMESVAHLLRAGGVELVGDGTAELVVVNTCTVTSMADRKSRQVVRRARRSNPNAHILVTGCSVVVDPASLSTADPAARLFDNNSKALLLAEVERLVAMPDGGPLPTLSGAEAAAARPSWVDHSGEETDAAAEERAADRTRAFVKIQDGCSFHCTYCIIPTARGPERSVPADRVLAAVDEAIAAGHREIVLTGINAGTYRDPSLDQPRQDRPGLDLPGLIGRILAETTIERIRLSSIEPQHVTDALLAAWRASAGRCLPHFHIPLQSGDDTILRRMGRRYSTADYASVVARVREAVPGAAIHADLIAGFPAEDDASWARTMDFLGGLSLAGVHVFRYSGRPGTPAIRMAGQVDDRTKKRRAAEGLELAAAARAHFAAEQLGHDLRILFERPLTGGAGGRPGAAPRWHGHADNYVSVAVDSAEPLRNRVGIVRAESIDPDAPDRVIGRLLSVK
jgi:threonylcarbamoyladenosine tRNA methylthiotransferase MtaB